MNYWIKQDDYWIMCFRDAEIGIMARAPEQDGIEDSNGTWLFDWWEPIRATLVEDASQEDMQILFSWVAECIVGDGKIPIVLCRVDVDTKEELEIWCIHDAKIENFKTDSGYITTFTIDFDKAKQFKGG